VRFYFSNYNLLIFISDKRSNIKHCRYLQKSEGYKKPLLIALGVSAVGRNIKLSKKNMNLYITNIKINTEAGSIRILTQI
jgi:hypothetical protein